MTQQTQLQLGVTLLLFLCCSSSLAKPLERPNVVLILTDNHGAWTLGCYGNPDIRTPNIDQLSREGMLFERCFSSNPVCSPTRATWLTGLMPSQHGVHCFIHPKVQRGPEAKNTIEEFRSLPDILSGEGYTCGLSGKWHLGDHLRPHEGFSYWVTKPSGHTTEFYNQQIVENGEIREEPKYMTDYWTDRGIEFIEQNKDRPFFLYLAYNGPYGLSSLLLNESRNRHAAFYADKELLSFPREQMHPWLHRNRDYLNNPTSMRRYAAEVSGVDDGVGRVMAALKRLGLDDNTLVVFTADQGLAGGQSGIWGMGDHTFPGSGFDSTMHVPLVVRQTGKIQGDQRSNNLVSNYDFYPTLLEYLNIDDPTPDDVPRPGRSYAGQLLGESASGNENWDDTVFYEFEVIRAVRTNDWKYIEHVKDGPRELYDLKNDPGELKNLVDDETHAETRDVLSKRLHGHFSVYADPKYDLTKGGGSKAMRMHSEVAPRASASGIDKSFTLDTTTVVLRGENLKRTADQRSITGWKDSSDRAVWTFGRVKAGTYDVQAEWSLANSAAAFRKNRLAIDLDGEPITEQLAPRQAGYVNPGVGRATTTGNWDTFENFLLGQITLTSGDHELTFYPAAELEGEWVRLRSLKLIPVDPKAAFRASPLRVPAGFQVEPAAIPPLVEHPMMACLDDRGRLFVAESSGSNDDGATLLKNRPHQILMLEDTDGDGRYDKRTVFKDQLTIPNGAAWYDGALYVCSAPHMWRLEDTDDDGKADKSDRLPITFNFNGNHSGFHGPSLGPDGRLYWCGGVHGWKLTAESEFDFEGPWTSRTPGAFAIWPDGSDPESIAHGGRANPVEVTFTEDGDVLGTVAVYDLEDGRHDALLHWVDGGVFNLTPGREVGLKPTGEPLTPISRRGHVAPSGVMVYRSGAFGDEYRGNVFLAEFNTHTVHRLELQPAGSTFTSRNHEFLASDSPYTHFTDVLEDADGSLLVIDTGGWFVHACPTSRIAKPEIRGAIYRIRKTDVDRVADPWGRKIDWTADHDRLTALLSDERFAVRDRAVNALVKRGEAALPALGRAMEYDNPITRRSAVWALCRMRSPASNQLLRAALGDSSEHVRLAATRSLATLRDPDAVTELEKLLTTDTPAVRREAATALGRIGNAGAVDSLLAVLSGNCDRFLEHALVCALIRIDDREGTLPGLTNNQPDVCRAVLIALDQMEHGNLTREQVTPLLDIDDERLQRTVLQVIAKRKTWVDEITGLMHSWLTEPTIPPSRVAVIRGTLVAFSADSKIQQLIADRLADADLPVETRLVLLEAIARSELTNWPAVWDSALQNCLQSADASVRLQTLATVSQANVRSLDDDIRGISADARQPAMLRVAALGVLADRGHAINDAAIDLLIAQVDGDVAPLDRITAASALGSAKLSSTQLHRVAELAGTAGPLELPILLNAFERVSDEVAGQNLVAALSRSPALEGLPFARVAAVIDRFPPGVRKSAEPLLKRLQVNSAEQAERLEELQATLSVGDPVAGRRVFHGRSASCAACHRVGQEGGQVGPNLSEIARIRTPRDLLESIVFPSATLARGYETYAVVTTAGKVVTGTIQRETPHAVYLRTSQREDVRVPRAEIEDLRRNSVSIMPQGLDKTISQSELNDLMAYLRSLK